MTIKDVGLFLGLGLVLMACNSKGACVINSGSLGMSCTDGTKSDCPEAATNTFNKGALCVTLGYTKQEGDHWVKP
jgi:hypothetical protein